MAGQREDWGRRQAQVGAQQGTAYRQPGSILRSIGELFQKPALTGDDLFKLYKTWSIMSDEYARGSTAGAYKAQPVGTFPEWVQTQGRVDPVTLRSFLDYIGKYPR